MKECFLGAPRRRPLLEAPRPPSEGLTLCLFFFFVKKFCWARLITGGSALCSSRTRRTAAVLLDGACLRAALVDALRLRAMLPLDAVFVSIVAGRTALLSSCP